MTKASAAILWNGKKSMSIEDVEIDSPQPNEILVQVFASGICHTDMVMRDQALPVPQPVVLGHEGSGVVAAVGSNVSRFKVGDRVAMTFNSCGHCGSCDAHEPAYCHAFFPLNFSGERMDGSTSIQQQDKKIHSHIFGQSSFATFAICNELNAVHVPEFMPLELAGPFGCGFQTGAGAVLKSLEVKPGSSVAIFGTGAVGLSAVMAAKIAGAASILAVDLHDGRLALAKELGATHCLNGSMSGLFDAINHQFPGGLNYIIDTTASTKLIEQASFCLAPRGVLGLVGAFGPGATLSFDATHILSGGRVVRGIVEGSSYPETFIPELMGYYRDGKFPVDKLVKYYDFADINQAIDDGESGKVIKPIVKM